ncbi:MAG: type II toxin-antitoxin system VapB family antitoxin [Candidatus Dormibacteria bacterium]
MTRRTTIEVDESLLAAASAVLQTQGLKQTVDRALNEVVRSAKRRALADRLASGDGLDFSEEVSAGARRWRSQPFS